MKYLEDTLLSQTFPVKCRVMVASEEIVRGLSNNGVVFFLRKRMEQGVDISARGREERDNNV